MTLDNTSSVVRWERVTAPDWAPEDADTPETYAANASGDLRAIVNPRADGLGYCIETWHEDVGQTTFWSAAEREDAIRFADQYVTTTVS